MDSSLIDEHQPLLGRDLERHASVASHSHLNGIVDFHADGDSDNPVEWPAAFKWAIVGLLALMAFTVTFTCISVVPVASRIANDLSHGNSTKSASVLLVTIWELGEAGGPLLIAPLSEVFGRYPVMNAANVLFIAATIMAALSQSTPLFIAARALTGLSVASNVLSPAIVGDMFIPEQRGSPMSLIMLAPLLGGAIGPAIAGGIAQSLGWRQVIWMSSVLASTCGILIFCCFKETYKVPILRKRAAKLRRQSGDLSLKTAFDVNEESDLRKLWDSIRRPAAVFFGSSVLLLLALFGSISFTYFYVLAVTLPDILQSKYGLSPALTGSTFLSFSVGSAISVGICNLTLDRIYIKLRDSDKSDNSITAKGKPEFRLPLVIFGAFTLPFAIALYGWTAELRLPLPLLILSISLIGFTLILAFVPLMAYVVDAFGVYSASALTAIIVSRCLMSTFLPLLTAPLTDSLGYGKGFTVLCGLSLALAPIPVIVMKFGSRLRQRSEFSRDE
ncbi:MFS general substrate transporter [Microthyrium microscopicum]|uniref:MFS general substrate transporter n=1 Tax=Microthyrium microscopicum TaxID=703497 RepID=A0A6A6UA33_9PEZI|nr:MFS general substrate transporter [Microthyrium microscopicum]